MRNLIETIEFNIEYYYFELRYAIRRVKFAYQRAIYGVDDSMYWNLWDVIVDVYIKGLTDLIKSKWSYPLNYKSLEDWISDLQFHLDALIEARNNYTTNVKSLTWLAKHNASLWD